MAGNGCLAGAREAYKKKVLAEYAELEERLKKKVTTNDRWEAATCSLIEVAHDRHDRLTCRTCEARATERQILLGAVAHASCGRQLAETASVVRPLGLPHRKTK